MLELDYIQRVISQLEQLIHKLADSPELEKPEWRADIQQFRHKKRDNILFVYLKVVRYVSLLNASVILLRNGYVHELCILARCMDESMSDIAFLLGPLGKDNQATDQQKTALEEFFQEQLKAHRTPLLESNKRNRVPRQKIHSSIAAMPENHINQHDLSRMFKNVQDVLSGYVHGAYEYIMELYGGPPFRFHTSGMKNTLREAEGLRQLITATYNGVMISRNVAQVLSKEEIANSILEIREDMEIHYPYFAENPVSLLRKLKG